MVQVKTFLIPEFLCSCFEAFQALTAQFHWLKIRINTRGKNMKCPETILNF